MIDLEKMDDALDARITAAGHWKIVEDGRLVCSDDAAVQAIVDAYTLDEAKSALIARVYQRAKALQDAFTDALGYAAGEMSTWPIKLAQAQALLSGGNVAAAWMLAADPARRVAVAERVVANGQAFGAFHVAVVDARDAHVGAIAGLANFQLLRDYDIDAGWPQG